MYMICYPEVFNILPVDVFPLEGDGDWISCMRVSTSVAMLSLCLQVWT